ncbi:DUF2786 domain-containing protein [Salmonella enterica]|nr:DUF2786 domain-containing protein [Salmonella enterica]ECP3550217.1 DUF2786 domain-containing protein [Salmonella enterica]EDY6476040.1 DUF2786 domain-containing protein [Salmonella enterica]EGN5274327.1 DUF2786 domain-containing protein [Salmonella enterica]EHC2618750.1 DUF2786 domain-containing protein [Salmonella enterica]
MNDKEKHLARIKKLLRLARGTSSPEEAMNAMAKAQAYMRKCGVSESDVELSEVREFASTGAPSDARSVPRYMHGLCTLVCRAFGVECYIGGRWRSSRSLKRYVNFYGPDSRPEIAAYAFDVLSRQMKAARKAYQDRHCKRCKPATRVARGDQFCEGWCSGAARVIQAFSVSPQEAGLMERYTQRLRERKDVRDGEMREAKDCRGADRAVTAGYYEGRNAKLHQGVNGRGDAPLSIGRS